MKPDSIKMHAGQPDATAPLFSCPEWLGTYAKECWAEYYPLLVDLHGDRLKKVDSLSFLRLCQNYGMWRMALDELDTHMATEMSLMCKAGETNGAVYQHPCIGIANKAEQRMDKLAEILGLNLNTRKAKTAPAAPLRRKPA